MEVDLHLIYVDAGPQKEMKLMIQYQLRFSLYAYR